MSWETIKLEAICEVITKGTTPSNIGASFTDKGIKYIRSEMLTSSKYISGHFLYISEETHEKLKRSKLQEGDILFSMAGAYLGKTAILRNEDVPSNTNQATALLRVDKEKYNNEYIYYYLNIPEVIKTVNAVQSQSAQPNINLKQIGQLEIKIPNKYSQDRIVGVLSLYDDLIANNQKQIELLEEAAQRLYKEWFVDLRFPGHEDRAIVDGVPEGWKKGTLNDYCEIKSGYAFKSKDWQNIGCGVIKIKDINNGFVDYSACDCVPTDVAEKAKLYYLGKGDLLIAMTGATIGKIGISTKDGYYANQRVGKVFLGDKPLERLPFVYCVLSLQSSLEHILNNSSASSAQPNISGEKIGDIEIIYSQDMIDKFNGILQPLFEKMILLRQNIEKLGKARDLLLPKLMNGEIEV